MFKIICVSNIEVGCIMYCLVKMHRKGHPYRRSRHLTLLGPLSIVCSKIQFVILAAYVIADRIEL